MTYKLKELTDLELLSKSEKKLRDEAMKKTAQWITTHYGRRCPDFSFGCFICETWFAYDRIFDDMTVFYKMTKKRIKGLH